MNLMNHQSDLALIFLVLIQLLNYVYVDAYHMLAYITLTLGLIVKFYLFSQFLKLMIFINILKNKKTILTKFKKYGQKLVSLIDGKKINKIYIFNSFLTLEKWIEMKNNEALLNLKLKKITKLMTASEYGDFQIRSLKSSRRTPTRTFIKSHEMQMVSFRTNLQPIIYNEKDFDIESDKSINLQIHNS